MSRHNKLIVHILSGTSDGNISFSKLCQLLKHLGFAERIKGSHHIFTKENVVEIINIQRRGSTSKPYQVKQIRNLIIKYKLANEAKK